MKKKMFFIALFMFFLSTSNVFAFTGKYNYEVTKLNKDLNGNITVSGWAILNAGVNDKGGSPRVRDNYMLGSGDSRYCTGNVNNYYTYTLYAVPVDKNNKVKSLSEAIVLGSQKGLSTHNLTTTMCYVPSKGVCLESYSSCYEDVGFSFTFTEGKVTGEKFQHGYILYLKINPSGKSDYNVSFPLIAYKDRISGFGNDYIYSDGNQVGVDMKVKVVAFNGYYQKCADNRNYCNKKNSNHFKHGTIYSVYGLKIDENGVTNYKVARNDNLYIPASWVSPPETYSVILPTPDKEITVESCVDKTVSQRDDSKKVLSCSGEQTFEGENYSSCTVDSYSYYTRKCYENNFLAKLNINEVVDGVTSINLTNGAGITASAKIKTDYQCEYTFDVEKFQTDYNNILYNLNYYEENSPDWNIAYNQKLKLDSILTNYINETNDLNNWNSNYDIKKAIVTLTAGNKSTNLVYNENTLKREPLGNNYCSSINNKVIKLNNNNSYQVFDLKCGEHHEIEYSLPTVCLSMKTGNVEPCNNSNTQINGGNKFYIDMSSFDGDISLKLTNLGKDGNWDLEMENCSYTIGKALKDQIKFRQIELTDPFIQKDNVGREIGRNYLNTKYSFINIIESDIWNGSFNYQYSISKKNINNIRKDTKEEGVSSYLGRNCYFSTNNKYICDFTRNKQEDGTNNQNKWFTNIVVNE